MANIDPVTGKNLGGRPKKAPPPAPGSVEALLLELATAKKELIALSAVCEDNASKLKFAESIRKISMSEVECRLKNSKIVNAALEKKEQDDFERADDMREISVILLKRTATPFGLYTLRRSLRGDVGWGEEESESWVIDAITDPLERKEAGL